MSDTSQPTPKSKVWIWILAGCGVAALGLVVLGILSAVVVPSVLGRFQLAQQAKARLDVARLSEAIEVYRIDANVLPETLDVLLQPDAAGSTYLEGSTALPLDPWGHPYGYARMDDNPGYRVWCLGRDGQPGGEGPDADIDSATVDSR